LCLGIGFELQHRVLERGTDRPAAEDHIEDRRLLVEPVED